MTRGERTAALAALGAGLERRDLACYEAAGRSPDVPIVGGGPPDARLCLLGRDPGAEEVRQGRPFVGAAGLAVRRALHRALFGREATGADDLLAAGERVFWANLVPFKPMGNAAWPPAVVRRFRPLVADALLTDWTGRDVVTLGAGAFSWFAIGAAPEVADALKAHWGREDRFQTSCEVTLTLDDPGLGPPRSRSLTLHPLPHPSPANAVWAGRFAGLLEARLAALGWNDATWRR